MEKPAVPFCCAIKHLDIQRFEKKEEYVLEYPFDVVFCIYEAQRKNQGPPDLPVV